MPDTRDRATVLRQRWQTLEIERAEARRRQRTIEQELAIVTCPWSVGDRFVAGSSNPRNAGTYEVMTIEPSRLTPLHPAPYLVIVRRIWQRRDREKHRRSPRLLDMALLGLVDVRRVDKRQTEA